ncbi:MAG: ubiquitin-conjugating enzyme E2 [Anaerolineales bacterium]|jgi:ubiquitin-protein ligase
MPDLTVTIVLPNGGARMADVPDDVVIGELLGELVALLELPTVGPDGRPMGYRLDSKALGRELTEDETLAAAQVPEEDRLILTADITAGAVSVAMSPRMRRLRNDYERMRELEGRTSLISFEAQSVRKGVPPERYVVTYSCKSIVGVNKRGAPKYGEHHQVEVYLHNQYPQRWPGLKWLTPIWHPNINHINGSVCIDAAWWTAARSLDRLIVMMGEMLQYKNFHDDPTKPPFPWDPEAARWCRAYREKHPDAFPVDKRELLRPERVKLRDEKTTAKKTSKGKKKPKIKKPKVKLK